MTQIRHISTAVVRPTNQNDQLTQRVELTPWDLRIIQLEYIQKGLLFSLQAAEKEAKQNLIQQLTASLSQALNIFYPLAGRLAVIQNADHTTSFFIDCNGDGAHFVHAAADGVTVAHILDPVYVPHHIVYNLFSFNAVRNYEGVSNALLAVQVTELVDGVFIGCSINHMVLDGTCFWHFFNTWSEISRTGSDYTKISQPRPAFGRQEFYDGAFDLPIRLPMSYDEIRSTKLLNMTEKSLDSLQSVVFNFPKEKITELKSKANAELGTNCDMITSLQALMAHLWRSTTRSRHLDHDQEVAYIVAVGMRQRLNPPLPKQYFGNAVFSVVVESTAGDLVLQHGLGHVASEIKAKIASRTAEEARKHLANWVKSPAFFSIRDSRNVALLTGSSPRFDVYGNDFGWGRPVAVRSGGANNMNGKLTVFPGAEDGGVDFEVCLLPETLQAMMEDAEFMDTVII